MLVNADNGTSISSTSNVAVGLLPVGWRGT